MLLLLSFCLYIPKILFGFWLAHTVWRESSLQALWFKFFLGIPLGMGLWSLGYYLWIWVGLSRFIFPWLELTVSLVFAALAFSTLKSLFNPLSFRWLKSPLNLVFLLVVLAAATLFTLRMYMNPHGNEDAWFIWNLDSRFIYRAQDFRILYAPGGPGWHPDYPLMVSLNIVSGWVMLQQDSTRVQMAVTALFTLVLPGILFSGLALLKDAKQAALATIVVLSSPLILNDGVSQQADIPVAGFVLASLVLTALFFKTQAGNLLFLAGLTTSLTAWAKNEGFLFIFVSAVLIVVFLAVQKQMRFIKNYLIGAGIPLLVILLYKFSLPVSNDLFARNDLVQLLDWNRYVYILQSMFQVIASLGSWPLISLPAVLFIYAMLAWFDCSDSVILKFVGLALLGQLAGYFVIYLLTPHGLTWHVGTSLGRLFLQLFPAGLFLFFYATKPPDFNLSKGWNHASHD
jgi:hypothetical protein